MVLYMALDGSTHCTLDVYHDVYVTFTTPHHNNQP